MICREAASYDQELVVDGAMFVAGAERGRGLVFVGGGALVVVESGRLPATRDEISEQLYFAVWLLQGKREKKGGELGVSEAGGSQSARPSLGAVAAFWGSLRGLGLVAGTGVHCRGC